MWTDESRQGRKAATAVCSASAVVTLASFFNINTMINGRQNLPSTGP
jgi:hypothetical protein